MYVLGGMSPIIRRRFEHVTGRIPRQHEAVPRRDLYTRLAQSDAAVLTLDHGSALESRLPAKSYDCLAVGVPVIAICPADAAVLRMDGAQRFHHISHRDVEGLAALLRQAAADRFVLKGGKRGSGTTWAHSAAALAAVLDRAVIGHA